MNRLSLYIGLCSLLSSCSLPWSQACSPILSTDWDPELGNIQDISSQTFRIRQPSEDCRFTEEQYQAVIKDWAKKRGKDASPLQGFFLGRIVNYPWITEHLVQSALQSSQWDINTGRATTGDSYSLVESFLLQEPFKQRLERPLEQHAVEISTVNIEKLIIDVPEQEAENTAGKVPVDALLYITLREKP